MIQHDSAQNIGLNIAAIGMMTVDDVYIETMNLTDQVAVTDMVRRGIGSYEEAGTVLASTFRRLDNFQSVYLGTGSTFIVAKDKRLGGLIIGGAGLGPLHGLSPLEGQGEIRDLVVLPEWRGHGIGARLLKRCLEEAKKHGYQRLYLETTPQMEQAQKLFIRYGFRPVTTGLQKGASSETMPCYYILETLA